MTAEKKIELLRNGEGYFDIYIAHAREAHDNGMAQQIYDDLFQKGHSVALELGSLGPGPQKIRQQLAAHDGYGVEIDRIEMNGP